MYGRPRSLLERIREPCRAPAAGRAGGRRRGALIALGLILLEIVADERKVTIHYIGLAGRHGWQNVLEKMLNDHDPDSLAEKVRFEIEAALLEPGRCVSDDPNMIGLLVNRNYLFVTYCWWEQQHDGLVLRAGGSDYFVHNKGDDFGGQEVIARFEGWFDYVRQSGRRVDFTDAAA